MIRSSCSICSLETKLKHMSTGSKFYGRMNGDVKHQGRDVSFRKFSEAIMS